jgi:signal transduction histidine kinase
MFFGGINGFNIFIPDSIKANPYIPKVIISDFQILNQSVNIGEKINGRVILQKPISETKEIVLSLKEYIFSIEFAALHYASPYRNKYLYMLEGFDKDWIKTDAMRRFVTYTTLKPGQYFFKVKASNNDGNWNPIPVELKITILPPYWQTWWFRIGIALMILMAAVGIHVYRVRSIEGQRKKLEIEVTERTTELKRSNKELEAFMYSVSHDLRAPLRGMDGFSQVLLEDYAEKLDKKGKNYLLRIRKASQYMGHLIDDLLKLSRLTRSEMHFGQVNLSHLVKSILQEYQQTYPGRNVEFIIEQDLDVKGDTSLLEVMLRNLIDNAWKFTSKKPDARIEFSATQNKGKKIFFIKDNGIGFDMAYSKNIFDVFQRYNTEFEGTGIGLATVQRIIYLHSGRIWAESKVDKGATFYFIIGNK